MYSQATQVCFMQTNYRLGVLKKSPTITIIVTIDLIMLLQPALILFLFQFSYVWPYFFSPNNSIRLELNEYNSKNEKFQRYERRWFVYWTVWTERAWTRYKFTSICNTCIDDKRISPPKKQYPTQIKRISFDRLSLLATTTQTNKNEK